ETVAARPRRGTATRDSPLRSSRNKLSRCKCRSPCATAKNAGSAMGAGVQPKARTTATTPPGPSPAARWSSVPTSAGFTRGERTWACPSAETREEEGQ
ncbi:unnamed protein product, partial [Ectocarpus sp. 4 AP-2014]